MTDKDDAFDEHKEDVQRLSNDLWDRISYYRVEYRFTYAEIVGILEMMKYELIHESADRATECEEEEDDDDY